jgi:uncharacterized protein
VAGVGESPYLGLPMPKCPTCGRAILPDDVPTRPFCSDRCRIVDLGRWLGGSYRIGSPVTEEDLDEGLPNSESDEGEVEPPQ